MRQRCRVFEENHMGVQHARSLEPGVRMDSFFVMYGARIPLSPWSFSIVSLQLQLQLQNGSSVISE